MIVKIFLLATVAVASARHVIVDVQRGVVQSERCPAEGHHLLPHEWDCTKFYYCEYGKKWVTPRDCSPGTEFSFDLQVCIHPAAADCQLSRVPPSSEESDESSEGSAELETDAPTTEVPSTEASVISTAHPRPTTTEAPTTEAVTEPETEVPSTEASVISTAHPRPTTTEASTTEAVTEPETEVPSTEASVISTAHPRPTTTEASTTEAVTETEVPSTEASVISTAHTRPTTTEAPTTEAATEPETEASVISTAHPTPTTTEDPTTEVVTETEVPSTEASVISTAHPRPTTTEAPTEAPELELLPNGCPADFDVHLLLPHETRCDQFYYCVFGEKVVRNCAPNTYFNVVLQTCDWPENVDCVNIETSESSEEESLEVSEELEGSGDPDIDNDGLLPNGCPADFNVHKLLPHESDCAKFYYCVFGETVERQCAPGSLFNAEIQTCDWPENVQCENSNNSNEDSNEVSGNSNENNGNSEENGILDNGCPADFDVHKLLPHESDCDKFYYCVFGDKVERSCAPGTHFSPSEQICDWPDNVQCENSNNSNEDNGNNSNENNGNSNEGSGSSNEGSGNSNEENGTSNEDNGNSEENGILDNGCPADFDVHKLLPHESDCDKFYYCVFGDKVERSCAPGTHFSPSEQICDWPENVKCGNSNNSNEDNGNNSNENNENSNEVSGSSNEGSGNSNEENGNSNEENGNSEEIGILDNGCPADFDVHKLLPHESDCGKFYYCVFGDKVERSCAPGTHFNPVEQVCDHPENAGCANAGSEEDQSSGSAENESQETSEENVASSENGNSEENGESAENGNESDRCKTSCNIPAWPHEHDCDKFWHCDGENAVLGTCSEGLHFNVNTQTCDFICNAGCVRDDVQSTPEHDGLKLFLPWNKVDKTIRKLYLGEK